MLDPEPVIFKGNTKFTVMGFDKSPLLQRKTGWNWLNHLSKRQCSLPGPPLPYPAIPSHLLAVHTPSPGWLPVKLTYSSCSAVPGLNPCFPLLNSHCLPLHLCFSKGILCHGLHVTLWWGLREKVNRLDCRVKKILEAPNWDLLPLNSSMGILEGWIR